MSVFQVTFSDYAMSELNKLPPHVQMNIVEAITNLSENDLKNPTERLGGFQRDGMQFYRLRAGDFRLYFDIHGDTLLCHYILHQHTLTDFIFRFRLPISEEQMVEQHSSFWKYLESLKK
jgi:mRNA-degrading endonuclease RelE of RelBE toxin-antitoxin system